MGAVIERLSCLNAGIESGIFVGFCDKLQKSEGSLMEREQEIGSKDASGLGDHCCFQF